MVEDSDNRPPKLLRSPGKPRHGKRIQEPGAKSLAQNSEKTKPKGAMHMETILSVGGLADSRRPYRPSLSERTILRQKLKVGAVSDNTRRTDLCGGCRVTGIPTAIIIPAQFLGLTNYW